MRRNSPDPLKLRIGYKTYIPIVFPSGITLPALSAYLPRSIPAVNGCKYVLFIPLHFEVVYIILLHLFIITHVDNIASEKRSHIGNFIFLA